MIGTALSVLFAQLATCRVLPNGKRLSDGFLKLFELLAILPLVLIAGLRVNVGTDYATYEMAYEDPDLLASHFGTGFMWLIYGLRWFSTNPRIFFVATSIIIYATYAHIAIKESESAAFSVLFFVISEDFFVSMNVISQYTAMAFIWMSAVALRKGKWKKSLILCIIASLFHQSALFFVVLIALYKMPLSIKKTSVLIILACIAGFLGRKYLINIITTYSDYGDYFSSKYAGNQLSVALPMMLIYVVIFLTTLILGDQAALERRSECRIFMIATLLCVVVMALSYVLTANAYRMTYNFIGIIGFYFPAVLKTFKTNKNRIIVEAAVVVLFTIWTTMLITHNNQNAFPYSSILQGCINTIKSIC